MKRTLGIPLAAVLLAGLFVSSSDAATPELKRWGAAVKAKFGGTTVVVSGIPHPSTEAFQAMTPEFTDLTGIKVEWDLIETGRIQSKQFLEHTAKTGRYDVYMFKGTSVVEYFAKGVLQPLMPYVKGELTPKGYDYEDLLPAAREALGTAGGTVLGIPTASESFFIAYRKDLFQKYGKQAPDTTEQLLELARFFKDKEPGISGIVMRAQTGRTLALAWSLLTHQFCGSMVDQKTWEVTLEKPETVRSLKYLLDLLKVGPTGIENYTWEEATSTFMAGKAAIWFKATALQPWLEDPKKSTIVGKIGYAPPPKGPCGRYGAIAGWSMGIPVHAPNKDAAWAFLAYMTSRDMAPTYAAKGGVISRVSSLDDPKYVSQNPEFVRALKASYEAAANLTGKGEKWVPPTDVATRIHERVGTHAGLALVGKMTPEEAVKAAARLDGKFVLRTNTELAAAEVAQTYESLWLVERMCREAKSTLEVRPIYHHRDDTSLGHVVACFLALWLEVDLQRRLDERGMDISWRGLMRDLCEVKAVEVTLDGHRYRLRTDLQGNAYAAFAAAGVRPPPVVTPLGPDPASPPEAAT